MDSLPTSLQTFDESALNVYPAEGQTFESYAPSSSGGGGGRGSGEGLIVFIQDASGQIVRMQCPVIVNDLPISNNHAQQHLSQLGQPVHSTPQDSYLSAAVGRQQSSGGHSLQQSYAGAPQAGAFQLKTSTMSIDQLSQSVRDQTAMQQTNYQSQLGGGGGGSGGQGIYHSHQAAGGKALQVNYPAHPLGSGGQAGYQSHQGGIQHQASYQSAAVRGSVGQQTTGLSCQVVGGIGQTGLTDRKGNGEVGETGEGVGQGESQETDYAMSSCQGQEEGGGYRGAVGGKDEKVFNHSGGIQNFQATNQNSSMSQSFVLGGTAPGGVGAEARHKTPVAVITPFHHVQSSGGGMSYPAAGAAGGGQPVYTTPTHQLSAGERSL